MLQQNIKSIFFRLLASFLAHGITHPTSDPLQIRVPNIAARDSIVNNYVPATLSASPSTSTSTATGAAFTATSGADIAFPQPGNANLASFGIPAIAFYQNVTLSKTNGYRPLSISICNVSATNIGASSDAAISSVWANSSGLAWEISNVTNLAGVQDFVGYWATQGYVPTTIAAAGSVADPVFITIVEQRPNQYIANFTMKSRFVAANGQAQPGTIQDLNTQALNTGFAPYSIAIYGSESNFGYAAVWLSNPNFDKYHLHVAESSSDFETTFAEETSLPGFRPHQIAISEDNFYASIFTNTYVGNWNLKQSISSRALNDAAISTQQGARPISVASHGKGDDIEFTVLYANSTLPVERIWKGDILATSSDTLDTTMSQFMKANSVRFAQLSAYSNGTQMGDWSFSWTEPDRGDIIDEGSSGQFLLVGQSRSFVAAVVQAILEDGPRVTLDSPAYGLIPDLSAPQDFRADSITIGQLLNNTSGYESSTDPEHDMRTISSSSGNMRSSTVLSKFNFVNYVYSKRPLDYAPGTQVADSDYNWDLLAEVCQKITATSYYAFLRDRILIPNGLNITQFTTIPKQQAPLVDTTSFGDTSFQVTLEDDRLGPASYNLMEDNLVPYTQGGNGMILEVATGSTGLAGTASSVAKFIGSHALVGAGPRTPGESRSSLAAGAFSYAESRADGVDWCLLMNTDNFRPDANPQTQLIDRINDIIGGMPANTASQ